MENEELLKKLLKEADLDGLLAMLRKFEDDGLQLILDGLGSELTETKKKQILSAIKNQAVIVDTQMKEWLVPAITTSYLNGAIEVDELLGSIKIPVGKETLTLELIKGAPEMKPHLDAVNSLLSDAYLDFGSGITGFVKGAEHVLNDAIRQQIQAKIGLGRLTGESIRDIKNAVKKTLSDRGFKVLLDRGGRQWTLDRYAEMLARTHVIRANTQATITRAAEFGIDIFEVSSHGATDALCAPHEGVFYSLSGTSKNYPPLAGNEPPYHPNCAHTLIPHPELE